MSTTVFVFTRHQGNSGTWSTYTFPYNITAFAQLGDDLYIRHGDFVSRVDTTINVDDYDGDDVPFVGQVRWSYLDFGTPGQTKMIESVDVIASGSPSVCVGWNQNNLNHVTTPIDVPDSDSMDQTPIPIPVSGPSFSFIVLFPGSVAWSLQSVIVNVHDTQAPA